MTTSARRAAWCALAVLLAPLVLEAVARVRAHLLYGSHNDVYELYGTDEATGLRSPLPDLRVRFACRADISTDSRGFRNPELVVPKPAGTVRLAFLGASQTFCAEVSGDAATYPARVAELLSRRWPEVRFDYVNAGVHAYGLDESRRRYVERVACLAPDVVVVYHATRDLAVDTRRVALEQGLVEEAAEESWLERRSFLARRVVQNLRWRAAQRAGHDESRKLEIDPAPLAAAFGERARALARACVADAPVVAFVTFATRARREQPVELQLENLAHAFTFMPYLGPGQVFDCYDAYNDALRCVAREEGCLVFEGPAGIPGSSDCFLDSVHLTDAGCEAMARLIVAGLEESASFRSLVEAR